MTTCSITDCPRPMYARQVCSAHYQQLRTQGELPPSIASSRACAVCGGVMTDRVSARAKFCSLDCKERARTIARHEAKAATARACEFCGSTIPVVSPSHARCCSYECSWRLQNKLKAAAAKAERRSRRSPCAYCGAPVGAERRAGVKYCSAECKKKAQEARWRVKSPDYMRGYLYGMKPGEFDQLLAAQGNSCAICKTTEPGGKGGWHVDHCHDSKSIRGVLCHHCNVMLGNAKDDPAVLRAGAAYLEEVPTS